MNNSVPALLVSMLAIGGVLFLLFRGPETVPVPVPVAGSASAEHRNVENFYGDITVGGNRVSSSTSASVTLSGNEFKNAKILDYTVNIPNKTLTLPASTTPMCTSLLTNEHRIVYIRHASTTAANTLTFAGGTAASGGFILISASSTKALHGRTDGYAMAELDLIRLPSSDCAAMLSLFND